MEHVWICQGRQPAAALHRVVTVEAQVVTVQQQCWRML